METINISFEILLEIYRIWDFIIYKKLKGIILMLPIGSIVYLKNGSRKIMILNRGAFLEKAGEKTIFDYSGCIYPIGLDAEQIFYFNEENVDKVIFEGFKDEEEDRYQELYQQWLIDNEGVLKRGKITE